MSDDGLRDHLATELKHPLRCQDPEARARDDSRGVFATF